jgi:DNA-binding response OmpR family regulator
MALPLTKQKKLGEILIRRGALRPEELDRALAVQTTKVLPIGSTLISLGICDDVEVTLALAEQWGVPGVDLKASTISTEALSVIPQEVAMSHNVLPLALQAQTVQVAIANPGETSLIDEIAFACGRQALPFVAPRAVLEEVIKAAFEAKAKGQSLWCGPRSTFDQPELVTLQPQESSAPSGMEVEPELTAGSLEAFVQSVPVAPARSPDAPPRVLAVDDEIEILDLIEKALTRKGIEIFKATRGREALEQLRAANPDLVLLDAMLPEIHGFEICHKIKQSQQFRHVPVIIISAIYTGWNFVQDVKRIYGADDYLAKPFRVVELVRRVEEALAKTKGRPRSPEVQHALKEAARECIAAAELFKAGQVQESCDAAQRAVEADPFDARAHFLLGMALHRMGKIYEAISEYERVVELAPALFSALKNLAVLYERQGFKAKAVEMWMRAVAQSPSDAVKQTIKAHLIGLI